MMVSIRKLVRCRAVISVFCAALMLWASFVNTPHPSAIIDQAAQAQFVEDHGHAHDDVVDHLWSLHGHAHDVVDHDHQSAVLNVELSQSEFTPRPAAYRSGSTNYLPVNVFPPKRPPRV